MPIPLFDAHCDTIHELMKNGGSLRENGLQLDLRRGMRYAPYAQVFAVWMPKCDDMYGAYKKSMARLKEEFSKNADILSLCKSADDAKAAAKAGKCAAFIAVEGAEKLDCSVEKLKDAYDEGVRLVNITWNYVNSLSGAAMAEDKSGLSEKGREFIKAAQALGIVVDMSHISEKAFFDTMEIASKPIIAGHSNAKALCPHPRNLTDQQFEAIISAGGVAGINFCPDFLGEDATVETIVEHIWHFLALGGSKNVCIGSDFDGVDALPKGMAGIEDVDKIYEIMLRRNLSEDLARDILYNNLLRVVRTICG